MNESDILLGQLATERIHAAQVANACVAVFGTERDSPATAPTAFREASVGYLAWALARFEQRDQLLNELIEQRHGAAGGTLEDTVPIELGALAAREGTSRQALVRLERALAADAPQQARTAWLAFGEFFNTHWSARREAIERHLARLPRIGSWRAVGVIDADSILEERARYAQLAAHLPPGITLLGSTGS
ncbi:MAG: hypothetical protein ACP5P4_01925 [Steroidobacteraceae bacterium]